MERSSHSSTWRAVTRILMLVILLILEWLSAVRGFSSRFKDSKEQQDSISSTSKSAMKLLLALMVVKACSWKRTGGRAAKELAEISTCCSWLQLTISGGKVDILLADRFSSVIRLKLRGSLGGILVMTLLLRLQVTRLVFLIRWNTASGICIS